MGLFPIPFNWELIGWQLEVKFFSWRLIQKSHGKQELKCCSFFFLLAVSFNLEETQDTEIKFHVISSFMHT